MQEYWERQALLAEQERALLSMQASGGGVAVARCVLHGELCWGHLCLFSPGATCAELLCKGSCCGGGPWQSWLITKRGR